MTKAGGSAAAGGFDFQHHVAAWAATHILAEKEVSLPWNLDSRTTFEWLRCETEQPVDDLLIGTSEQGLIFAQAKRTLALSTATGSELSSVCDQFVRQYILCTTKTETGKLWERPLECERDRLVIVTSNGSPATLREHLSGALHAIRSLLPSSTLEDVSLNDREKHALTIFRSHIKSAWSKNSEISLDSQKERQILELVYIHTLDFTNGHHEIQSKSLLRQNVLQSPESADLAWETIVAFCANLAISQAGADRTRIQWQLAHAGLKLKPVNSFRSDIEKLRKYSATTQESLAHLSRITFAGKEIKINRPVDVALREMAEIASTIVVGEPGAGKSASLFTLAESLIAGRQDCIVLAVDRIEATSLSALRIEIGLEHDLLEVMENWPGNSRAFLIIDALDAARKADTATFLKDLLRILVEKKARWNIVASVRKFDLRYDREIKRLFKGQPSSNFQDLEFQSLRHLNVPKFEKIELSQIEAQSVVLWQLLTLASEELTKLLCVPFNLRLAAELLSDNADIDVLKPLRTQLELMEQYWISRVIRTDHLADARQTILRTVCESLIENQSLRTSRAILPAPSEQIHFLLSNQILIEWQNSPGDQPDSTSIAFSHHFLFDYAVARLILSDSTETATSRLTKNRDLTLSIRPSILIYFRRLWFSSSDKRQFWNEVFNLVDANIPEIGKIIGPTVAAEAAKSIEELEPLFQRFETTNQQFGTSHRVTRDLINALVVKASSKESLTGEGAGPWSKLIVKLSSLPHEKIIFSMQRLLSSICEEWRGMSDSELADAGTAARYLLTLALSSPITNRWLLDNSIITTVRTFASSPVEGANLLRKIIDSDWLKGNGSQSLFPLAREIENLATLSPELVRDIYISAFTYTPTSEKSILGNSQIMSLSSTNDQDHKMVLYLLAQNYSSLLSNAVELATTTAIATTQIFIDNRKSFRSAEPPDSTTFSFLAESTTVEADVSRIWDSGDLYDEQSEISILNQFTEHVRSLCNAPNGNTTLLIVLKLIAKHNRAAVFWKRIIKIGTTNFKTLGNILVPLAAEEAILVGGDTTIEIGEFLRTNFPLLSAEWKRKIESTILNIAIKGGAISERERAETRNRLIWCIPREALMLSESVELVKMLASQEREPSNIEPEYFREWSEPYTEAMHFKDLGIDMANPENQLLVALERPVKDFANTHLNSVPSEAETETVFPDLKLLLKCLADDTAHSEKLGDYARASLAGASARIAKREDLSPKSEVGKFVLDSLSTAAVSNQPTYEESSNERFNDSPTWGGSAPRCEAAEGLLYLARLNAYRDTTAKELMEQLSLDPVASVRYQVGTRLGVLYKFDPNSMWTLLERIAKEETNRGVLQGLFAGPLRQLGFLESSRVAQLTLIVHERTTTGAGAQKVRNSCTRLLSELCVWKDEPISTAFVRKLASEPWSNPASFYLLSSLRDPICHGSTQARDEDADRVRHRAVELMNILVATSIEQWNIFQNSRALDKKLTAADLEIESAVARLLDSISMEIYIASRAFDKSRGNNSKEYSDSPQVEKRFYDDLGATIRLLATSKLPIVIHHLLQTIDYFTVISPRTAFIDAGLLIRNGSQAGYHFEGLAVELVVALVERFIAEQRQLLREDVDCKTVLIEILDIFVEAGWTEAIQLTYKLEDIFR